MSSEEAELTTDPATPEEQTESEVQADNVENTELSKVVDSQTQHEETQEQTDGEEAGEQPADGEEAEPVEEPETDGKRKLTEDDIKTAPMDFRFPTTNQARHCFTRYIEYHKCVRAKGEDDPECNKYARYYRSLCPGEWIDKWNEQRENGTFPGPL